MMDKLFIWRTLIFAFMLCVLAWDMLSSLTLHTPPLAHRELLLAAVLLWLASVFFPQNSDDDWQLT